MSKYGLPLMVAAGLLLAAALGAVGGIHWAGRRGPGAVRAGEGGSEQQEGSVTAAKAPRPPSLPRFLSARPEPTEEGSTTKVLPGSSRRARHARFLAEAAANTAPPRPELGAEGPQPSPTALARAREVRAALESAVAAHPGVRVRFADCSAGTCVARVESTEAASINRLLDDKPHLPPGFTVRAHERLTAFNGRVFEADFVEGGAP
jgi:hypothetical protein